MARATKHQIEHLKRVERTKQLILRKAVDHMKENPDNPIIKIDAFALANELNFSFSSVYHYQRQLKHEIPIEQTGHNVTIFAHKLKKWIKEIGGLSEADDGKEKKD